MCEEHPDQVRTFLAQVIENCSREFLKEFFVADNLGLDLDLHEYLSDDLTAELGHRDYLDA
ncbi:MAG: hypothetical protein EBZ49_00720 [Proteobacteria bacterium]|nr:hypothetical protein [Pseudomonadota bacterium]